MLSKPGISQNIKQLFLKKHILYVVAFIGVWIITLSSAYRTLYKLQDNEDTENDLLLKSQGYTRTYRMLPNGIIGEVWIGGEGKTVQMETSTIISLVATISTGLIMAIIR
mmetsp:Transcript_3201/g.3959  ORF Transcript_3201/g.3959 Transcript_3201/m.3959 type:complete len:110 (+) Transcript_3201:674-1003(+)